VLGAASDIAAEATPRLKGVAAELLGKPNRWAALHATAGTGRGASRPSGLACASAVVDHGGLLVYGGLGREGLSDRLWQCELATGVWRVVSTRGPEPSPRAAHTAVVHGGAMFIFGGHSKGEGGGDTLLSDVHRLDLREGRWEPYRTGGGDGRGGGEPKATTLDFVQPVSRCSHAAAAIGGSMFVFGGESLKCAQKCKEEAACVKVDAVDDITESSEITDITASISEDEITTEELRTPHAPGGGGGGGGGGGADSPCSDALPPQFEMLRDLHALPLDEPGPWRRVHTSGCGPSPRSGAAATAIGGRLFVCGGWDEAKRELGDLWECAARRGPAPSRPTNASTPEETRSPNSPLSGTGYAVAYGTC